MTTPSCACPAAPSHARFAVDGLLGDEGYDSTTDDAKSVKRGGSCIRASSTSKQKLRGPRRPLTACGGGLVVAANSKLTFARACGTLRCITSQLCTWMCYHPSPLHVPCTPHTLLYGPPALGAPLPYIPVVSGFLSLPSPLPRHLA